MSVTEEVKQKLDIVEVVSGYTQLHKSGKNFRGLCPFHAEKNPSFYVYPDRGSWYCFGRCNTGGDVFAFVMKRENLSFGEALRTLAERAGVPLRPQPQAEAQAREREALYRLNEAAADYYHRLLVPSPVGEAARGYLKKRGVAIDTVLEFKLGYAPGSHHSLHPHLEGLGFPREEILQVGLARQSDDGSMHDLFRNRLLFPIRDAAGKLCGFGGRALDDATPKYLNSPATPVFDKGSLLYALDRAREAIRKQDRVVIVEGYMDALIAHQAGFTETVATMGVALTQNHIAALKRLTRNLILAMDADEAGVEAIMKGTEVAESSWDEKVMPWKGMIKYCDGTDADIRVAVLPAGKDPDEVILEDTEKWKAILLSARATIDFVIEFFATRVDIRRWEGQAVLLERIRPLFYAIQDPIRLGDRYQKLLRLGVPEALLSQAVRQSGRTRVPMVPSHSVTHLPRPRDVEEYSLALCLSFPDLRETAKELPTGLFEDSLNRELFRRWQETPDVAALQEEMEEPLREHLDRVLAYPLSPLSPERRQAAFQQAWLRLQERHLRQALAARRDALSLATGDTAHQEAPEGLTQDALSTLEQKEDNIQLKQIFLEKRSVSKKTMP